MTDERPIGYAYVDGSLVESTSTSSPSIGGAAGAMLSTNRDLLTFAKALTDGTLLSAESQAAMRAFVPGEDYSAFGIIHGYGLGFEQYATDAIVVNGHMGTGEAQSAFLGYDTERGTIVAVGTNVAVGGPQALMAIEALTAIGEAR
jgi:D-alanyl-D-alanine carboxypeptidase